MQFVFVSGVTIPRQVKPDENVFIHLSFDGYVPDYMIPEGGDSYFSLRMVPPGPLSYFYSINDEYFTSDGTKTKNAAEPIKTVRGDKSNDRKWSWTLAKSRR